MRARFYDPSLYRFISQDPMDGNATQPLSQNHYTYSYDNPINLSDPSGLAVDPNAANNCVYVCMVNGKINYVGITNDVGRRTLQWLKQGRSLTSIPSLKNLTRIQARSLEQYLIEKFGQAKSVNPATKLLNKINSIGANSPKYQAAKQWATEFFESHPDIEEDITALEGAL